MTILHIDGCDHYGPTTANVKWTSVADPAHLSVVTGRTGSGQALGVGKDGSVYRIIRQSSTKVTLGLAVRKSTLGYGNWGPLVTLLQGANPAIVIYFTEAGTIEVRRGPTTVIATSPLVLSVGVWQYWEFQVLLDVSAGSVEVRLDGDGDSPVISVSGINTQGYGAYIDGLQLGPSDWLSGPTTYFDDIVILDDTGTEDEGNDFLGDVTVATLHPIADGSASGFTPSTGTDHYAVVDESSLDASDYLRSNTVGAKELFTFDEFAGSQKIIAVQLTAGVVNTQVGGTIAMRALVKSGTVPTENEGDVSSYVSASMKGVSNVFPKEPTDDTAWTTEKVNSLEGGIKIYA